MRGVRGDISPEIGRRQCFSLAVKFGLTKDDLDDVAQQLVEMGGLIDKWHAEEGKKLIDLLSLRNGQSLTELAEQASEDAWTEVAHDFETKFPGYVAKLVKGKVQVYES